MKPYRVVKKVKETADVVSLQLVDATTGGRPNFVAGQYVTVLFPDLDLPSGKAYSLSSPPSASYLQITVKKIGPYSTRLHQLEPGDELLMSTPYGFLNPEFDTPIVAIAGGVGIAPLLSIILDTLERDPGREIELWFSNRTLDDILFKATLDDLAQRHKRFRTRHFITRQKKLPTGCVQGRIDVAAALSKSGPSPDTFFFICGREDFVGSIWHGLMANGISDSKIATETFF